jgi:hypothetical protein
MVKMKDIIQAQINSLKNYPPSKRTIEDFLNEMHHKEVLVIFGDRTYHVDRFEFGVVTGRVRLFVGKPV